MRIVADIHERSSGVPGELRRLELLVDEGHLAAGDYTVKGYAVIERKTTRGLHLSVQDGRFWGQMGKVRRADGRPYLLVEGRSVYDGPLADEAIRGLVLAVSDLGITVVRTLDPGDSARWIRRIVIRQGSRRSVNRPPYAQRVKRSDHESPAERALAAAPGISTVTARNLLERFGCLMHVLQASPGELMTVAGVGSSKAQAIRALGEGLAIPAQAGIAKPRA
jgi:ERCC4-type nuclease